MLWSFGFTGHQFRDCQFLISFRPKFMHLDVHAFGRFVMTCALLSSLVVVSTACGLVIVISSPTLAPVIFEFIRSMDTTHVLQERLRPYQLYASSNWPRHECIVECHLEGEAATGKKHLGTSGRYVTKLIGLR